MIKKQIILLLTLFISLKNFGQDTSKVEYIKFLAPSIQNNKGGEDANRSLSIYLPPGYANSKDRYPVIYFLHGFAVQDKEMMEWIGFRNLMDSAIKAGYLQPAILVLPSTLR